MADIDINDLTNADALGDGEGIFDKLMQTMTLHLNDQFKNGRITGTDYANVYLGTLQSVLEQSMQFLLTEQEAGHRADLVANQVRESEEQIDLISAQTAKEYEAVAASQANTVRENLLNNKQVLKLQKETVLIENQNNEVVADTGRKNQLLVEQLNKLQAEVNLLVQKLLTEKAQTADEVVQYTGTNAIGGVLGAQVDLYKYQKAGIEGKYKVDSLKTMMDSWGIMFSIMDGAMDGIDYVMPSIMLDATPTGTYGTNTSIDGLVTAVTGHTFP